MAQRATGGAKAYAEGEARGYRQRVLTLGEQLLLVALDADKGVIRESAALQVGLNAAGMAELLAAGWLGLHQPGGPPRVTVAEDGDPLITDHKLLTQVLRQARATPEGDRHPERCLRNWTSPSLHGYLDWLRKRDIITWDKPKVDKARYGRFHLLDAEAAASARAMVENVAAGTRPTERELDFAGIVHGVGLDEHLYKGRRNRSKREALATALERQRFALLIPRALPKAVSGPTYRPGSGSSDSNLNAAITMGGTWGNTP